MPVRPEDRREPVARFFARPIHVSFWVDDLIFIMSTPEHGDCVGFEGGCAMCGELYSRALKVHEMWVKARALKSLNMPLSTVGLGAEGARWARSGVSAVEAIGRVYCPIAWPPPGHDPGADCGVALLPGSGPMWPWDILD